MKEKEGEESKGGVEEGGRWKRKEIRKWPHHPNVSLDQGATRSQSKMLLIFQGGNGPEALSLGSAQGTWGRTMVQIRGIHSIQGAGINISTHN